MFSAEPREAEVKLFSAGPIRAIQDKLSRPVLSNLFEQGLLQMQMATPLNNSPDGTK